MQNERPVHDKLWDLIKAIKFGMFTYRDAHGVLHANPMTTQNKSMDENATLYFFMRSDSETVSAVAADQQVCVAYADPTSDSYVSVSGEARVDHDQAKKEALFTPMSKAWYPAGPTDPNLTLVAVHLKHAEYWETDEGAMVQLFKMAEAAITGDGPPDLGDHKKVHL